MSSTDIEILEEICNSYAEEIKNLKAKLQAAESKLEEVAQIESIEIEVTPDGHAYIVSPWNTKLPIGRHIIHPQVQSNADKEIELAIQYDLGKKNGLEIGWQFGISDNELEYNQLKDHLKKHLDMHTTAESLPMRRFMLCVSRLPGGYLKGGIGNG